MNMLFNRDKIKNNLAQIFESVRFNNGLTQQKMANIIGMSQGSISKIESTEITLSTPEFISFALNFNIEIENIKLGFIDNKKKCLKEPRRIKNFHKIPKKYGKFATTNIRFLLILFDSIKSQYGINHFNDMVNSLKIKPPYLNILDNQIDMKFGYDLFEILNTQENISLEKLLLSEKENSYICDSFTESYKNLNDGIKILTSFNKNQEHYNIDFIRNFQKISDKEGILQITISPQLKKRIKTEKDQDFLNFMFNYNVLFARQILQYDTNTNYVISEEVKDNSNSLYLTVKKI